LGGLAFLAGLQAGFKARQHSLRQPLPIHCSSRPDAEQALRASARAVCVTCLPGAARLLAGAGTESACALGVVLLATCCRSVAAPAKGRMAAGPLADGPLLTRCHRGLVRRF